jgi:hypothetical protein
MSLDAVSSAFDSTKATLLSRARSRILTPSSGVCVLMSYAEMPDTPASRRPRAMCEPASPKPMNPIFSWWLRLKAFGGSLNTGERFTKCQHDHHVPRVLQTGFIPLLGGSCCRFSSAIPVPMCPTPRQPFLPPVAVLLPDRRVSTGSLPSSRRNRIVNSTRASRAANRRTLP